MNIKRIITPNIYGPGGALSGDRLRFIPSTIIKSLNAKEEGNSKNYKIRGSGNMYRDFIYIEDFCKTVERFLVNPGCSEVLLRSKQSLTSLNNVVRLIDEINGTYGSFESKNSEDDFFLEDYKKLIGSIENLEVDNEVTVNKGVRMTNNWVKEELGYD